MWQKIAYLDGNAYHEEEKDSGCLENKKRKYFKYADVS